MSLEKGFPWAFENLQFKGFSIAGQTTSIFFNNAKICFDIAQGLPFQLNAHLYCLTHLHSDHGSGINYLLSQRSLFRLPTAQILLPHEHIKSLEVILKEWRKIEEFDYDYKLIGVSDGMLFDFNDNYKVRAFRTTHRIASYGYIVYEVKKKLKSEFQGFSREQLIEKRKMNLTLDEEVLHPIIAFTGDTQIEFLKAHPDVVRCEVLFMECTYLDERKSIAHTREWGHLHLDELIEAAETFKNKCICLIHLSARYNTTEALKILDQKLPPDLKEKIMLFPRPY